MKMLYLDFTLLFHEDTLTQLQESLKLRYNIFLTGSCGFIVYSKGRNRDIKLANQ